MRLPAALPALVADPALAYFPTWLPSGYHYRSHFSNGPNDFGLAFDKTQAMHDQLGYQVREADCPGGAVRTFRIDGVRIRWSGTYTDQQAWRCLTTRHVSLIVSASRSIPGDSALDTPQRLNDARMLARLVANTEHVH